MEIPYGFELDSESGLYYKEEAGYDEATGAPVRIITWLDAQSGAMQQVNYPCGNAPTLYEPPPGFEPCTGSRLYYYSEYMMDEESGVALQRFTYFDPDNGTYEQVDYPAEPPAQVQEAVFVAEEPAEAPPYVEETPPEVAAPPYVEEIPTEAAAPPYVEEAQPVEEAPPYVEETPPVEEAPPEPPPEFDDLPPLSQAPYESQNYPQRSKKSKLPVVLTVFGLALLAGVGVYGWQIGWFGGQSTPAVMPSVEASGAAQSDGQSGAPDDGERVVDEQALAAVRQTVEKAQVEVAYRSASSADITLKYVPIGNSYPASIPGMNKNSMLYYWGVKIGNYEVALCYFCQDENDTAMLTPGDMQCDLWEMTLQENGKSSSHSIASLDYTLTDNSITFHNVTLPASSGIDFTTGSFDCTVWVQVGEASAQEQKQPSVQRSEFAPLSEGLLADSFRYVNEEAGMEVLLLLRKQENAFKMDIDFAGSTYTINGGFELLEGNVLRLESGNSAPDYIWRGGARLQLLEDGSLLLESPEQLGVMSAGQRLLPTDWGTGQGMDTTNSAAFPYEGFYVCMDPGLPEEYRPSILLGADMRFSMNINTGQGMVSGSGTFVWDMQPEMLYFNFEQINGRDPGEGYYEAEVKILDSSRIRFLNEGFGLMGYNDLYGIFTRQ